MSKPVTSSERNFPEAEVLTLAETAAYLRVPEAAVLEMIDVAAFPAQKVGGEWRFLKRAVADWLRFGHRAQRQLPLPWMLDHPMWEELFWSLEQRILARLGAPERPSPERGSKQAVLKHFGTFQNDGDLEEQLTSIRARREAAGE